MRELLKITRKQIWQNVWNLRFLLAVVLGAFACMLPTIIYWEGMNFRETTVLEFFFLGDFKKIAESSFDFSSLAIISSFYLSPWFLMLMVAISAFPAVSLFVDEYYSATVYFTLSGSSINRYSTVKFAAAGLTGGLVFLCGFGLYALLIFLRFPSASQYPLEMLLEYQMRYDTSMWYFAGMIWHMIIVAVLSASVIMMFSVFMRDRYFLFGIPMLFVFFMDRLFVYIGTINGEIYEEKKGWWRLLVPSSYPNFYTTFERNLGLPYGCFFLLAAVELICLYFIFRKRIRRKVRG